MEERTIKKIITHPGMAHRDEFLAICLLLGYQENAFEFKEINRRNHTEEDIQDPYTWVIDVGGDIDRVRNNYDHHQLPKDHAPVCALTLIATEVGIDPESARYIWPWFEFSEVLDTKGPFQTLEKYNIPKAAFMATMSPVESAITGMFSKQDIITCDSPLWGLMEDIGKGLIIQYHMIDERYRLLCKSYKKITQVVEAVETEGMVVADMTWIDRADSPSLATEMFFSMHFPEVSIVISQDDRGEGLSLFRRGDHPQVDFSRINKEPGVLFAHANGFIAKLAKGVDPWDLVRKSILRQS